MTAAVSTEAADLFIYPFEISLAFLHSFLKFGRNYFSSLDDVSTTKKIFLIRTFRNIIFKKK
jgi:hypothetical protein